MRSLFPAFALVVPLMLSACGDDAVKPGSLNVHWTQGDFATCSSRFVTKLEARALKKKGGDLVGTSGKVTCPASDKSGSIPIVDLDPGTYYVEVEGFNQAGDGTYLGVIEKQAVKEGKASDTAEIELEGKPASITINWTLPGGVQCNVANIAKVQVQVYFNATQQTVKVADQTLPCSTGTVTIPELAPNSDVAISLKGLDSANKAIAQARLEGESLEAGEEYAETVPLESCPGTPPTCP